MILAIRIYPPLKIYAAAPKYDSFKGEYENFWITSFTRYIKANIYYIFETPIGSFKAIYPVDILLEYWK
jgi:hypothetical protein